MSQPAPGLPVWSNRERFLTACLAALRREVIGWVRSLCRGRDMLPGDSAPPAFLSTSMRQPAAASPATRLEPSAHPRSLPRAPAHITHRATKAEVQDAVGVTTPSPASIRATT